VTRLLRLVARAPLAHVITAYAAAGAAALALPQPVRVAVVAPVILLVPGYALQHAVGVRVDRITRLALSAALSLAVVPLAGLAVWALHGTLDAQRVLALLAAFAIVPALAALARRPRPAARVAAGGGTLGGAVRVAVVAGAAVALIAVLLEVLPGAPAERFTQVALAGTWAGLDDAVTVRPGARVVVDVEVTNHTGATAMLLVEPTMKGAQWRGEAVRLEDGATWRGTVEGAVPRGGCLHRLRVGVRDADGGPALEGVPAWFATRDPLPESCQVRGADA
jgi:uncharacterized membrane protein